MDCSLSIVIPTCGRDSVLVDTVSSLFDLTPGALEILVVDQSRRHDHGTERQLCRWDEQGTIKWIRLPEPSITRAMNTGLLKAAGEIVLFLDDDLVPDTGLLAMHLRNYRDPEIQAVVGRVLQPGQGSTDDDPRGPGKSLWRDLCFKFNSTARCPVHNCMAGNLSVRRAAALAAGGMDENFIGVAYRFETEFARRLWRRAGMIMFDGAAVIHHLKAPQGGTRIHGDPLRSHSPLHGAGEYYFALREGGTSREKLSFFLWRFRSALGRKFYLRKPWWLPVKMTGECRAMLLAMRLARRPGRYLESSPAEGVQP